MNTRNLLGLLSGTAICLLLLTSCKKEVSNTTGWAYNDPKNGGFEVVSFQGQVTGPGLVFIEGGRFTMGRMEEDVMADWDNYPRTVTVPSFYMDEHEIRNLDWLEYLHWLERVFLPADMPSVHRSALPDTTVWRKRLAYNEDLVEYYFRYPEYRYYPVVGISWEQAIRYCVWRTDRVNEQILIDQGLAVHNTDPNPETYFNTTAYFVYPEYEYSSDKRLQYIATGEERNARMEDGILLPKYRLPSEAEWEYAALGLIGNSLGERVLERRTYPWNGQILRTDDKKYMGEFVANLRVGRGDYMGTAGRLNDGAAYTCPVIAYWPNDYGLYNMAGNVAEWVMDVYRPLSPEDNVDISPYRGNVYTTLKTLEDGTVEDRDEQGNVPMEPVTDFKNDRRRNYRSANNINHLDGDWASQLEMETWKNSDNTLGTNEMYKKTTKSYSMIDDNARVYKGGSWQDIQYWASPGNRRYLDQTESTDYIGFRCAMSRLGSSSGK